MAAKTLPDYDDLHKMLVVDVEKGKLFWKNRDDRSRHWNSRWAGQEAMSYIDNSGYRVGCINNKPYLAHRIIWKMAKGCEPPPIIDHINGDTIDNRICNLQEVTHAENMQKANRKTKHHKTSSGMTGVVWNDPVKKWVVQVYRNNKRYYLGLYKDLEAAKKVRLNFKL